MELDEIKEQVKSLGRNEYVKEYSYRYYYKDTLGNLILDNKLNDTYKTSRKSYERFTQEVTRDITHSGEVALRKAKVKDSEGKLTSIIYIEETKKEVQDKDRQLKLDLIEANVYDKFCKVFNIDSPTKEDLVKKIRELDSFETKVYQNNRIEWYIERLEERDMFCGDELEDTTALLLGIGNLKLEETNE